MQSAKSDLVALVDVLVRALSNSWRCPRNTRRRSVCSHYAECFSPASDLVNTNATGFILAHAQLLR